MEALGNIAASLEFGASVPTPFADAAPDLADRWGLPVMPLDGKVPIIGNWQHMAFGSKQVAALAEKYPTANVGLKTGKRSRLTVVDIDDPTQRDTIVEVCGNSPLEVRTPRGGSHFYYRHTDERNRSGIIPGVDVRGEGGQVAAPPSIRADAIPYKFAANDWHAIPDIPPLRDGALAELDRMRIGDAGDVVSQYSRQSETGTRNDDLFRALMEHAPRLGSQEALTDFAERLNAELTDPLPLDEVRRTARSVWTYEAEGRNWIGGQQHREARMSLYRASPDAALMLQFLHDHHGGKQTSFAIAPKAMQQAQLIGRWNARRYREARKCLIDQGHILQVRKGGSKRGDPALFRWPDKGTVLDHNLLNTVAGV